MLNVPSQQSGLNREYTNQNKNVSKLNKATTKMKDNSKMKNDTKYKTNQTNDKVQYVTHNNMIATPKELISNDFNQKGQQYIESREQQQEKGKQQSKQQTVKGSNSIMESSQKSLMQSMDKSSGSDQKQSSSNMNEKSQSASKMSETENSEEEQIKKKKKKVNNTLTEKDLEAFVFIDLEETETQTFLYIPSKIFLQDSTISKELIKANQKYDLLVKDKLGNDNFSARGTQSFNFEPKQKGFQTFKIEKADCGIQQQSYDIQDSFAKDEFTQKELLQQEILLAVDKELKEKLNNPYCLLPTNMQSLLLHSKKDISNQREYQEQMNKIESQKVKKNQLTGGTTTNQMSNQPTNSYIDRDSSKQNQTGSINPNTSQYQSKMRQLTVQKTFVNKNNTQKGLDNAQQQIDIEQQELQYLAEVIKLSENQPSEQEQQALSNEQLYLSSKYMERILNQNTYHKQIIAYRNYPEVKIEKMETQDQNKRLGGIRNKINLNKNQNQKIEDDKNTKKEENNLQYLFKFSCELTKERQVSCVDWNYMNQDLLACSYGEFDMNTKGNGILAFWTLKNPSYPERLIRTESRILTCKFSEINPNLIAAGTMDGGVLIFDIRKNTNKPVAQNYDINDKSKSGKHNDAVWEVQWVKKGGKMDSGEALVSISSDGQILEWSMKKGLEKTELMKLKRQNTQSKDNQEQGVNFRLAAGFSFDFIKNEPSMYLTCTEENTLHRCSKSYQEQYLDTYLGHQGPIYKVRCNPFWSDIFLTCSADWSAKLWNWREDSFIQSFQSLDLQDEVMDIEWSPHSSTLFGTVCKDGRLELWDLTKNNMLDPFASEKNDGNNIFPSKTCLKFCSGAPILVTGDVAGDARVYRLYGYEDCDPNIQEERLIKLLHPAGYTKGNKDIQEVQI